MSNPFEDDKSQYLVLINAEGQHSLWPAHLAVPAGWDAVHGAETRRSCLEYVEREWTDLRPNSLVAEMGG
ncbi:MbtH family protein [Streptomyces xanthophaeus]|uniref:MbtH family protein n=1 Tax=Streptomyces xanthophaeus TaxID=67385 RepID=UPI00372177D3